MMLSLSRPVNPQLIQAAKLGQPLQGVPKCHAPKIAAGNAEKFADDIVKLLSSFLFFEQNYFSF